MRIITSVDIITSSLQKANLDKLFLPSIIKQLQIREYDKGEFVAMMDEMPKGLHILLEGYAEVKAFSEEGKEAFLNNLYPKEMIGDLELLLKTHYIDNVEAKCNLKTLYIPKRLFQNILDISPFLHFMLSTITAKLVNHTNYYTKLKLYGARGILCRYILDLYYHYENKEFNFSVKQVAPSIGVSERHIRRLLKDLEIRGAIKKYPYKIRITDERLLKKLVDNNNDEKNI